MNRQIKTYSELVSLPTFEERFLYLKLDGIPGSETFGSKRWLNQVLYHSQEWKRFRDRIVVRDNGCDLGLEGYEIFGSVYIHHLNPITYEDVVERHANLMNPENAICVKFTTHNALHYGNSRLVLLENTERKPNDTCLWKKVD